MVILDTLGINVRFDIQVKLSETYYIGKDEIQFLFAANKGTDFGILKSGFWWGNVPNYARCKAILAQYSKLPTLILTK
jgi:DNA repair protein RecN (Recombination protein N)